MNRPIEIFFSYAHEDEALMDDVRRQLIGFDRRNIIRKWHDRLITPGAEWHGQIDQRLRTSDVILLFISPYFIESDYCYDAEMTEAMRRHKNGEARVIPIILRPCLWHEELFGRLQALPSDGKPLDIWPNRNEGAVNVAEGIMRAVREVIARSPKANGQLGAQAVPGQSRPLDPRSELEIGLQETQRLTHSADRDSALKRLVQFGLKRDVPEIMAEYIEKLQYSADRDASTR